MRAMLLGRILFGIGGESLGVAQTRLTTSYFRGKELALALGINLSVARLGSVANDLISPIIGSYSIPLAAWAGFLTCLISLGCSFALVYIDKGSDVPASSLALSPSPLTAGGPHANGKISFFSVLDFPLPYHLINFILIFLYGTVIPFNSIHQAFLEQRWFQGDPVKSAQIMSIPDTISALLVPFIGSICDRFGHRPHILILCSFIIATCHFILGFADISSPITPLVFLGTAYACLLVFWPCIPLLIPSSHLATAYGLSTALWNLCNFVFPLITATLRKFDPSYRLSEAFFGILGVAGFATAVTLWWVDKTIWNSILTLPESRKESDFELLSLDTPGSPGSPSSQRLQSRLPTLGGLGGKSRYTQLQSNSSDILFESTDDDVEIDNVELDMDLEGVALVRRRSWDFGSGSSQELGIHDTPTSVINL